MKTVKISDESIEEIATRIGHQITNETSKNRTLRRIVSGLKPAFIHVFPVLVCAVLFSWIISVFAVFSSSIDTFTRQIMLAYTTLTPIFAFLILAYSLGKK